MAKKPKELSGVTKEPERHWLRVELTEKEKMEAAQSQASAFLQIGYLEDQLGGIKQKFKTDIEAQTLKMKKNAELVENGYEYRDVDCEWTKDWAKGEKFCTRLDTGEIFKSKIKIEPSERQGVLETVATINVENKE